MAEPTFFESLMKTLKVGEEPKKSTKEYTVPDSIPLIGGKKFTLSNEFSEEQEKFMSDARASNERDRKRREEEARKSLVKETVDAAKTTEEDTPLPKPPKPPKTGQNPDETGTGGTEGTVETQPKGGTIVADKVYDDDALRPKRSLMTRYKRRGLLSGADADTMLN
jgi:hypothetical protein